MRAYVVDAHLEDLWLCCLDREPDVVQVTHALSPSAELCFRNDFPLHFFHQVLTFYIM